MTPADRMIVALDVDSVSRANELVRQLSPQISSYKVGLELVHASGFSIFDSISDAGAAQIFYDCKLHDIPNTVAGAIKAIVRRGVWMCNIHCGGGSEMIRAAVKSAEAAAHDLKRSKPLLIGVTVLTSIDDEMLRDELGVKRDLTTHVVSLAMMAQAAGLDGVVASPREVHAIREACGQSFLIVAPGVRPAGSETHDQKRVMTPAETLQAGADYLVIGRAITQAENPAAALDELLQSV